MNEIYWFLLLVLNFGAILLVYRLFGKAGLFIWIPISTIIANLQVLKLVELFGIEATLGNIVYATSFLATDILSENYGKKDAKKAVYFGFIGLICMTIFMQVALLFNPSQNDWANDSLTSLFALMPRIAFGSLAAYLLSQLHDVRAYDYWKVKFPETKYIWIRNNASTMVSQFIDTIVFTFIAFAGTMPWNVFLQVFLSTYFLKWIVAALDTPLVYVAKRWKNKVPSTL
ncbi:MAG: hypothetical protein B6229_05815 [Spirochaetaceae bacterium 4572_7]|nr:MAG: hypothetical protein B6229_05815 [Spirochaetaceae bacterium 4572_7]